MSEGWILITCAATYVVVAGALFALTENDIEGRGALAALLWPALLFALVVFGPFWLLGWGAYKLTRRLRGMHV